MDWTLCFRILEHLKELGLLKAGDTVFDPMAGTGRTALAACSLGFEAITLELEERFIGFQRDNLAYASRKLGRQLDWTILQGDARKLSEILRERGLVAVTSPPYAEAQTGGGIVTTGYKNTGDDVAGRCGYELAKHGQTPGQIGNMKDKPLKAVMSPPYGEAVNAGKGGIDWEKAGRLDRLPENNPSPSVQGTQEWRYSKDPGNIGNLPDRPLKCVTSPPYEGHVGNGGRATEIDIAKGIGGDLGRYGSSEGQLAEGSYLIAMRQVYAEIAKIATTLCVVLKDPTRNGKIRSLGYDTWKLLEAIGWTIVDYHRAILFQEIQRADLWGDILTRPKGRISFFKRLSYAKGQPVASYEHVIIAVLVGSADSMIGTKKRPALSAECALPTDQSNV